MYIEKLPSGNYRYQMQFVEDRTGKKKRVSCTLPKNTGKAHREAEKILAEKIRQVNSSFGNSPETLSEAFTAYLADKSIRWRPGTLRRNYWASERLKTILGADTLIDKLSARYISEQFAECGKDPGTLNEYLSRLKGFLFWCYQTDRISDVAWTAKLKPYPEPTAREKNAEKYLERDELMQLLPALKVDINRMLISFLALSGLRIGEALCLTKDDVDLSARLIHVTKTTDHATGNVLEGAKTSSSVRDVYIQDELLDLCREIKKYMMKTSVLCGFRTDLFFSDLEGKPLQYARLNKYFAQNTEKIIGRRLTLHSLRHTHASLMFEGGASLEAVSLRLGHADSGITKQIYLHITERLKEQYNQTFDQIKILS